MKTLSPYKVKNTSGFSLRDFPTSVPGPSRDELTKVTREALSQTGEIQEILYAQASTALLLIFQGMDTSGKDGTIKTVTDSMNPQGVETHSFKQPSDAELRHDFIWRSALVVPPRGIVGVFNRSYYENVLVARVHPEIVLKERLPGISSLSDVNDAFWQKRYENINAYEDILASNGTRIVKFFLHISYQEQRKRLLERINNKDKNWKFSSSDMYERQYWDEYMEAYRQAIANTSTKTSRWWVIPSDDKIFSRYLVSKIILRALKKIGPRIPRLPKTELVKLDHYRAELMRDKPNEQ